MEVMFIILGLIGSYFIGSIPSAVWYGRFFHNIDIREYGSGNAGATNTLRVLGKKAGILVMFFDILKGCLATNAAYILGYYGIVSPEDIVIYKLMFGLASVIGHIFPVFAQFKGGKGVATLTGMIFSIHYQAALICLVVFILVLILSKYVSLGSILAALAFPIVMLLPRFSPDQPIVIVFAFAIFAIVVLTHQKNITRILHGEENKTVIRLRRKEDQ